MTDPKSIVLRFNNCINHADIDGLSELMTEDHVFIDTEHNRMEGASDSRTMAWKPFFKLFPDYHNVFEKITVNGTKVIVQGYSVCSDERLNNLRAIYNFFGGILLWQGMNLGQYIK